MQKNAAWDFEVLACDKQFHRAIIAVLNAGYNPMEIHSENNRCLWNL